MVLGPSWHSGTQQRCSVRLHSLADELENLANLAQTLESVNQLRYSLPLVTYLYFQAGAPGSPGHSLSRSGSRSRRLSETGSPGRAVYLATPASPRPRHAPAPRPVSHQSSPLGFPGLAAQIAAAGNSALSLPGRINQLSDTEEQEASTR